MTSRSAVHTPDIHLGNGGRIGIEMYEISDCFYFYAPPFRPHLLTAMTRTQTQRDGNCMMRDIFVGLIEIVIFHSSVVCWWWAASFAFSSSCTFLKSDVKVFGSILLGRESQHPTHKPSHVTVV